MGAAKRLVPARVGTLVDGVKIGVADFALKVLQRLLGADEGRSGFAADDFVFAGFELDVSARLLA